MTNLGPLGMKQHLRDAAKEQQRQARSQGAIMRPKPGQPALPLDDSVSWEAGAQNTLMRYGARLVVWNFALQRTTAPTTTVRLAKVPGDFVPEGPVYDTCWANLNGVGLLTLGRDAWLMVQPTTATLFRGSLTFTAAL